MTPINRVALVSCYQECRVDVLAPTGDEGRGRLRYAGGSRQTG